MNIKIIVNDGKELQIIDRLIQTGLMNDRKEFLKDIIKEKGEKINITYVNKPKSKTIFAIRDKNTKKIITNLTNPNHSFHLHLKRCKNILRKRKANGYNIDNLEIVEYTLVENDCKYDLT